MTGLGGGGDRERNNPESESCLQLQSDALTILSPLLEWEQTRSTTIQSHTVRSCPTQALITVGFPSRARGVKAANYPD